MPLYQIPNDVKRFVAAQAARDEWYVLGHDGHTWAVRIPCRTADEARDLAHRLTRGDHDGSVRVDICPRDDLDAAS